MQNIFITARHEGDRFESYLGPSLNTIKTKCINVADMKDTSEEKTISIKYNLGVEIAKDKNIIDDNTIVVFAKSDVHIVDPLFSDKISMIFEDNPSVGIVGVLGVKEINSGRSIYDKDNHPVNGIIYTIDEAQDKGEHIQYSKNGYYDGIVGVDDSLFAIRGSILLDGKVSFDYSTNKGFGIEASIKTILAGYDSVVADILIVSKDDTHHNYKLVDDIVNGIGITFPVTVESLGKKFNSIVDIDI